MDVARFHQYLTRQVPSLSADELIELTAAFMLRSVKKQALLVQPGVVADHRIYVLHGALQVYAADPAGVEHTIFL